MQVAICNGKHETLVGMSIRTPNTGYKLTKLNADFDIVHLLRNGPENLQFDLPVESTPTCRNFCTVALSRH
jgi:hypothetical protein